MTPSSQASRQGEFRSGEIRVVGDEVRSMFGSIASRYDLANSVLSLGIHKWWRVRLSKHWKELPDEPVLDLCTGTGDVLRDLQKSFSRCIGADFCFPMMSQGKARSSERDAETLFLQGDALELPFQESSFGLVTVSFGVRNLESLQAGLSEMLRVLQPGGKLLILEFGQPRFRPWRAVFDFYSSTILPFVGGLVTGNRSAYEYLPKTSKEFPCREALVKELRDAGFTDCAWESLTGGIAYIYSGKKTLEVSSS